MHIFFTNTTPKAEVKLFFKEYMNKKLIFVGLATLVLTQQALFASTTATATVTWTVASIDAISVSGNPGTLTVNSATAGSAPSSAADSTTTYSVTTNNTARKVTGAVGVAMPTGVTLSVNLAAPTGGTSIGSVGLTTTAQSLVTGIANLAQSALGITYTLAATVSAAQASAQTATVTYTVGP